MLLEKKSAIPPARVKRFFPKAKVPVGAHSVPKSIPSIPNHHKVSKTSSSSTPNHVFQKVKQKVKASRHLEKKSAIPSKRVKRFFPKAKVPVGAHSVPKSSPSIPNHHKVSKTSSSSVPNHVFQNAMNSASMYGQNARKNALPPPSKSGFNHFVKFRKSKNAPTFMNRNENIVLNMVEFWEYLKINSDVNTSNTLSTYMSNVKMWHVYEHEKTGVVGEFPSWPTPSQNDELAKRLRDANKFFIALDAKKGEKRIPLTNGLLQMIKPHLPGSVHMQSEVFDCLLHTKLTGNRTGEITAEKKTSNHSSFLTAGRVKIHQGQVDFSVWSKSESPTIELTYVKAAEVAPLVTRYGSDWNFYTSTKKRMAKKKSTDPFYTDDNGRPLTYQNVYKALTTACLALGLPTGLVGCHSGRIYKATLMAYQGKSVIDIMKRGRWKSDAWKVYVNALVKHAYDIGADPHAFKIGDLAIPLDKLPNHPEFSRN